MDKQISLASRRRLRYLARQRGDIACKRLFESQLTLIPT